MRTSGWIVREKETRKVLFETFNPSWVKALNTSKYEAIPVQEYLASLNNNYPRTHPMQIIETPEGSKEAKPAFAPGPWRLEFKQRPSFGFLIIAANGEEVIDQRAVASSTDQKTIEDNHQAVGFDENARLENFQRSVVLRSIQTQNANASLIAAAPDLFRAVRILLGDDSEYASQHYTDRVKFARAVLAKANAL